MRIRYRDLPDAVIGKTDRNGERRRMGNNGRNVRLSRKQIERRRKKRLRRKVFELSVILVITLLLLCIGNLYACMDELQTTIKRLEDQGFRPYVQTEDAESGDAQEGYADSIAPIAVEMPVERTEDEVLARLDELGESDPAILEIRQQYEQYPKELLAALANNPEMRDFAAGYPGENGNGVGALTAGEKAQDFPLFLQWDPRWGYRAYGESCIGLAGCGPTCLSMALFYLTRDGSLTPDKIAGYSMENGYYVEGTGTAWALMEDVPKRYGLGVSKPAIQADSLIAVLDGGGVIICSVSRGDFTTTGHYIVIYGYESDGFLVNDPNCVARSGKWAFSRLRSQIKNIWAYMPEG